MKPLQRRPWGSGLDGVDRVRDVGGGELLAVAPLQVVAELVVAGASLVYPHLVARSALGAVASIVSSRGYIRLVIQLSVRLLPISGLKLTTSVVVAMVSVGAAPRRGRLSTRGAGGTGRQGRGPRRPR